MTSARELIQANEGCKLHPYQCTEGKLTIGYGRNLEAKGITQLEADLMLDMDLEECERDLRTFDFWDSLNRTRKAVLTDMRYQLGMAGLKQFKKMLAAINRGQYGVAAIGLLDSRYAIQTPNRAKYNAQLMRHGRSQ